MELLNAAQVHGSKVDILRTDARHFDLNGKTGPVEEPGKPSFQQQMLAAMEGVNADQIKASDLYQKMLIDPQSVDAQDVTIASAQARMSLDLTKNVVERAVQAYRDIINMR